MMALPGVPKMDNDEGGSGSGGNKDEISGRSRGGARGTCPPPPPTYFG